jgi:hypothetical protein
MIRKLLIEALEDKLTFNIESKDHYKGQDYMVIYLTKGDELLAYADFSKYDNKVYIDNIETKIKGFGYGQMIMKHLAGIYGYENLERSSLTPDGVKMRDKLDKHFNFDYNKHQESKNRHLNLNVIENIKNPIIKSFLMGVIKNGQSKTWSEFKTKPEFLDLNKKIDKELGFDFNEISDIAEWVKGSVTNDNLPEDDIPNWVLKDLSKLFKI